MTAPLDPWANVSTLDLLAALRKHPAVGVEFALLRELRERGVKPADRG